MIITDTKTRILDAAEELFVQQGISDTSLRAVTGAAGANLAAVNYHFGGKEGMIRAIFERTVAPVNSERIRRLDALETGTASPRLEEVLEAFYRPVAEMAYADPDRSERTMLLYSRIHAEPSPTLHEMFLDLFRDVAPRFVTALGRCTPELSADERNWKFRMVVGLMVHALQAFPKAEDLHTLPEVQYTPLTEDELVNRLVMFAAAGWRATSSHPKETER